MKRVWKRYWPFIVAVPCMLIALVLTAVQSGMIGLNLGDLEGIEYKHRGVSQEWNMIKVHDKRLAVLLSFDETKEEAVFSVYTKRDGFYYGYYARYTGGIEEIRDQVLGLRVLDRTSPPSVALLSMNSQGVARVEAIGEGGEIQECTVDPAAPFALTLRDPREILLFDEAGNPVELGEMIERSNQVVGNQAPPAPEEEPAS